MKRRDFLTASTAAFASPRLALAGGKAGPDWSWLDACLRERVASGYFDGMGLLIGRGGTILHEAYFGAARADTVLHVASAGKWTAAAAIAAIVDQGSLRWDDPVDRFLPQFPAPLAKATLRQLLSHTSGFAAYQPDGARRDYYQTLSESVAQIVGLAPASAPGEVFQYGGLAMQVAGRMAELADGREFDAIFQARIAAPLGMRASAYTPVSTEPGFSPMLGGAFKTSVRDYGRFLMMIAQDGRYRGRRILSVGAVAAMQADQLRGARVGGTEYVEQVRGDRRKDIYGLGQFREECDAGGAATLLSSPGWAGAYPWLDKRYGVWGCVLAKANVEVAVADGYSTFLGSGIYAPMVRSALDDSRSAGVRRGRLGPLYYEESGQGAPLIFIHGHSFDRRQWEAQIAHFERHYRVIRYDLRGYGRSAMPDEGQPFLHAEDLRALMDALGVARAHLVGLSLGGFVATDFLALHPQRVAGAVLAGGDFFDRPGPDEPWTASALAERRQEIAALRRKGVHAFKREWFERLVAGGGSGREALRQPLWRMIDEWQAWQPLHVEPRLLLGRSVRAQLARTRPAAPVLVIRGDRETPQFALADLLPQARVSIIADCGHVSNMEQPARFTAAVADFLRAV